MSRDRIDMRVDPLIYQFLAESAQRAEQTLTAYILQAAVKRAVQDSIDRVLAERGLEVLGDHGLAGVSIEGDGDGDQGADVGLAVPTLPSPGTITDVTDRCVS